MNGTLQWMATASFLVERVHSGTLKETVERLATDDARRDLARIRQAEASAGMCDPAVAQWGDAERTMRRLKVSQYVWCISWFACGFPRVVLGHKHAASLMATKTRRESIPDARAPWDSFLIDVPSGLLSDSDLPTRITHVAFCRANDHFIVVPMIENGGGVGLFDFGSVAALGDLEAQASGMVNGNDSTLLARLVLGVCMEMTSTTYKGGSIRPQPVKRDPRTGEPRTWTFQLTRDVKVDCRDAVRAYSQGKTHASPSVQTLVRGHWKQQVCGKGGAERKNIFVEPYWRGPEDAHIALRKHDVKHADDNMETT